jgi:hypothetical protein
MIVCQGISFAFWELFEFSSKISSGPFTFIINLVILTTFVIVSFKEKSRILAILPISELYNKSKADLGFFLPKSG